VRHALDVVFKERNRVLPIALMEVCDSLRQLCVTRLVPEYSPGTASPGQPEQINRYDNHSDVSVLIVVYIVVEVESEVGVPWPNLHGEEP